MLKLTDYDNTILVAKKEDQDYSLHLVKWGKQWRFYLQDGVVGEIYENKTNYITKAYGYARSQGFKDSEILAKYPRNSEVIITPSQKVAINTAISLLGDSNSDYAEQAYYHLKQLVKSF